MMNIVYASDNNYAKYLIISLYSLLRANKNNKITFYILDLGISDENKILIENIITDHLQQINFITINIDDFRQFPKTIAYISLATYARLNITNYLTQIDKALYIDVDTLINADLSELYQTDLANYYLAAAPDLFIEINHSKYKQQIGLQPNTTYFNAGILLINLYQWRTLDIMHSSIEWIQSHINVAKYQDQDILNVLFENKVKLLPTKFNFTPEERKQIKNKKLVAHSPVSIFHYCGERKFWHTDCKHSRSLLAYEIESELKEMYPSDQTYLEPLSTKNKIDKNFREFKDKFLYKIY